MEQHSRFGSLDTQHESSDDDSSDAGHKKSSEKSKSSRRFELAHAKSRREEAGKGIFSLLEEARPKIVDTPKQPEQRHVPAERPLIDKPEKLEAVSGTPEVDTDPEMLLTDEKQPVVQNILEAEHTALQQELQAAEPDSTVAAEAAHATRFIDEVVKRVEDGALPDETLFDEAFHDILDELGLEDSAPENDTSDDHRDTIDSEDDRDTHDVEDDDGTASSSGATDGGMGGTPPLGGGMGGAAGGSPPFGGGGGTPPPGGTGTPPPAGAGGGGFGGTPPPGGGVVPPMPVGPPPGPAGVLRPPTPVVIEAPTRRNGRRELLVGGLVGYLIGRRRGRIKTEKKLLPVQQSLERQVKDLSDQITARELKIRQLTAENLQNSKQQQAPEQLSTTPKPERADRLPTATVEMSAKAALKVEQQAMVDLTVQQAEKLGAIVVPVPERVRKQPEAAQDAPSKQQESQESLEVAARTQEGDMDIRQLMEQRSIKSHEAEAVVEPYLKSDAHHEQLLQKEALPPHEPEGFEKLRKKQQTHLPDTSMRPQPASIDSAGDTAQYSPVAAMNSQLQQTVGASHNTDGRKNSNRTLLWMGIVTGTVIIIGLVLFLVR